MFMDDKTRKLLEIDRVLAGLHPITPFGLQCKNDMKPFKVHEKVELLEELDRIEKLRELVEKQRAVFVDIRTNMRQLKDLRRSVERSINGATLNSVELFELKNFSLLIKAIEAGQRGIHWNLPEKYKVEELGWLDKLLDPDNSGIKTFYIYDSYSMKLAEIRNMKAALERQFDEHRRVLVRKIEQELGIQTRASGEITVSHAQKDMVDMLKVNPSFSVVNETYINITFKLKPTDEMLQYQKEIEVLKQEESLEETSILEELSRKIGENGKAILCDMDAVGEFDLLIAKAYLANAQNAVKPMVAEDHSYKIKAGRHPLVDEALKKKGKDFTPISVSLDRGVTLITGANMGGKTVSLKMTGLLLAMMHYGLFVPAEHFEASMCHFIYLLAGDEQSIDQGLSTFGAEMRSINDILQKSENQGLILMDELARGTNPHEGFAISASIINYLMDKETITLITTHFDGLVRQGIKHLQVKGLRSIDYSKVQDPERISEYMDYSLIEITDSCNVPKDAINIARLMGLPDEILDYAEKVFHERC